MSISENGNEALQIRQHFGIVGDGPQTALETFQSFFGCCQKVQYVVPPGNDDGPYWDWIRNTFLTPDVQLRFTFYNYEKANGRSFILREPQISAFLKVQFSTPGLNSAFVFDEVEEATLESGNIMMKSRQFTVTHKFENGHQYILHGFLWAELTPNLKICKSDIQHYFHNLITPRAPISELSLEESAAVYIPNEYGMPEVFFHTLEVGDALTTLEDIMATTQSLGLSPSDALEKWLRTVHGIEQSSTDDVLTSSEQDDEATESDTMESAA